MKAITFTKIKDFDPQQIFDCGQCFRWERMQTESVSSSGEQGCAGKPIWRGMVGSRLAEVTYREEEGKLEIRDSLLELDRCTGEEAEEFWRNYLDLDRDYGRIKDYLVGGGCSRTPDGNKVRDEVMEKAVEAGQGIRILNQDRWETLVSFIISQNNNIPRIKKCIESLAEALGEPIEVPESLASGKKYFALPTPAVLAGASVEELAECRLGYRDRYLIEAARQIMEGGWDEASGRCRFLEKLSAGRVSCEESIDGLRCLCGVGPKVANCVALFCLGQVDSFPLDVWMKRVMNRLYGIPENDMKAMKKYAEEHFAPYGGIAQQYLFYYISRRDRF